MEELDSDATEKVANNEEVLQKIAADSRKLILDTLSKQPVDLKMLMGLENMTDEEFWDLNPTETDGIIQKKVNDNYDKKIAFKQYDAFIEKLYKEKPFITDGVNTSVKTRIGVFTGRIRLYGRKQIKVGAKYVQFSDIDKSELPRFDKTKYEAWCEQQWQIVLRKEKAKIHDEINADIWKQMLTHKYLPYSTTLKTLTFDSNQTNVKWVSRRMAQELYAQLITQGVILLLRDQLCQNAFGKDYASMLNHVKNLKTQLAEEKQREREREREREQEVAASYRSSNYSSSSHRVCADCGGAGRVNAWNSYLRKYIVVRCQSCGGTGAAGYTTDYIEGGQRHRSRFEQDLGRMLGTGGGGGGIFGN